MTNGQETSMSEWEKGLERAITGFAEESAAGHPDIAETWLAVAEDCREHIRIEAMPPADRTAYLTVAVVPF
jgi:hypothetical protein